MSRGRRRRRLEVWSYWHYQLLEDMAVLVATLVVTATHPKKRRRGSELMFVVATYFKQKVVP